VTEANQRSLGSAFGHSTCRSHITRASRMTWMNLINMLKISHLRIAECLGVVG